MRVLITGVSGMVGGALTRLLLAHDHQVWGTSRDPQASARREPRLRQVLAWPAGDLVSTDAIVHLAGESVGGRWTAAKRRAIEESRITQTRQLVDAIARLPERPRVLVSASAMGYYGDRGDLELTEDAPPGEGFLAEVCVGWEREVARARELGLRVVSLRFGLILAAEGGALAELRKTFQLGLGGRMGSGAQWWSWVHLRDALDVIERVLVDPSADAPLNVATPHPLRQIDFARELAAVLHRPALLPAPAFALRAALGGFADELLFSRRLVPAGLMQSGYRFEYPQLGDALRALLGR